MYTTRARIWYDYLYILHMEQQQITWPCHTGKKVEQLPLFPISQKEKKNLL